MRRRVSPRPAAARINVTPMIDVVMVLIVFYLMVGRMASDQRADLPLPPSHAGIDEPVDEALVIEVRRPVTPGGPALLSLAGTPISPEALEQALRAELEAVPGRAIRVRADRALAYGLIEPAIDAARRAGATAIRLAAERTAP